MKLISCHVENYGRLHRLDLEFTDGLNVLLEENGWGKSTLVSFFGAMLYGFDGDRKQKTAENERRHYSPWQGGAYGGTIVFETGGRRYALTRFFHDKETNDEFELRDAETNLISQDYTVHIGEELFGVDKESFLRTVLIRQSLASGYIKEGKLQLLGEEGAVTDDMSVRIGGKEDTDAYGRMDAAEKILKDLLNRYSPKAKTGVIRKLNGEITDLETQLRSSAGLEKEAELLKQRKKENETKIRETEAAIKTLREMQKKAAAEKVLAADRAHLDHLKADLDSAKEAYDAVLKEAENMPPEQESIEETGNSPEKADRRGVILLAAGAAVFIAGIGLIILASMHGKSMNPGIIAAFAGMLICFLGGVLEKRKQDVSKKALEKEVEELKTRKRGPEPGAAEKTLREAAEALRCFAETHDTAAIGRFSPTAGLSDEETIAEQLESRREELAEMKEKTICLNRSLYENGEACDARAQTEAELAELRKKRDRLTENYAILERTQLLLRKADAAQGVRISGPVLKNFRKYYELLTGRRGDCFRIDAGLHITVDEEGAQRETALLSGGWRDLTGICFRMACADAMYPDEKPVLFMDDPFVNLDDEKTERGKIFLKKISESCQIIYLTCHASRV